jgi:hypothetical protein
MARGLFRVWIVLSALWALVSAILIHWDISFLMSPDGLPLLIVPPLFVLALGAGVVWALAGFKGH